MRTRITLSHDVIKHIHSTLDSARTSQDTGDGLCSERRRVEILSETFAPATSHMQLLAELEFTMALSVRCCIELQSP